MEPPHRSNNSGEQVEENAKVCRKLQQLGEEHAGNIQWIICSLQPQVLVLHPLEKSFALDAHLMTEELRKELEKYFNYVIQRQREEEVELGPFTDKNKRRRIEMPPLSYKKPRVASSSSNSRSYGRPAVHNMRQRYSRSVVASSNMSHCRSTAASDMGVYGRAGLASSIGNSIGNNIRSVVTSSSGSNA